MHKDGEWRASKLVGVNVYNDANEKIGDINEVILDKSGKVANVILGVGGFLGMGEHYVAVAFDKLEMGERAGSLNNCFNFNRAREYACHKRGQQCACCVGWRATGHPVTATTTTTTRSANENWYPDHAVYNATKTS